MCTFYTSQKNQIIHNLTQRIEMAFKIQIVTFETWKTIKCLSQLGCFHPLDNFFFLSMKCNKHGSLNIINKF